MARVFERTIGNLELLPEIVNFWKRSGEHLEPISAADAVKVFLDAAREDYSNRRTLSDVQQRLRKFAAYFGDRPLHEITVTNLEQYLGTYSHGWNRWNTYKRLRPFYTLAERRQWVPKNLMEEIPKPKVPTPERRVYSPDEFQRLLWKAEPTPTWGGDNPFSGLLPYVVLSGFCFLRTAELVAKYADEQTLQWSDVHEEEIHVRPGVAKGTKRERGDERFVPVHSAARKWLEPIRQSAGPCVPYSAVKFGRLWRGLTAAAAVTRIPNGLRHSAISYSIAANPETGIALTAQYAGNSENTIRKHYLRALRREQGNKWFQVTNLVEENARLWREHSKLRPDWEMAEWEWQQAHPDERDDEDYDPDRPLPAP